MKMLTGKRTDGFPPIPAESGLARVAMMFAGALMLTWPALLNGYPLLYPDSMTYVADGPLVANAIFLHRYADYYGMRSLFYSLGILPFHWNVTLWPIVLFQALITAWILWLALRACIPRATVIYFLFLVAALGALTGLSWFASLVLPDVLAPLLALSIFLAVFAPETLSRVEKLFVLIVIFWSVASHATHLMLAVGVCSLFAALWLARVPCVLRRAKSILTVALVVLLSVASQVTLNAFLYGKLSLNGKRPLFLMARVIADGPGRTYLEKNCGVVRLAICRYAKNLPQSADDFLWDQNGIWQDATPDIELQLRKEEIPFVLAVLRQYPREQLERSAENFWNQLMTFDLNIFDPNPWMLEQFNTECSGDRQAYLRSRQANSSLPLEFFSLIQASSLGLSALLVLFSVPHLWRRRLQRLSALWLMILFTVLMNALVTGTLSMVENRFQARVIWLVPFAAGVLLLERADEFIPRLKSLFIRRREVESLVSSN